jgi:undecaprenyl pyrophosphate synthase
MSESTGVPERGRRNGDERVSAAEPRRMLHAAIIMDGNGRWATARGLPRIAGHRAGAEALRRTVEAAPDLGIGAVTVYAFSSDNWKRPPAEVNALMRLFHNYLRKEGERCIENGMRVTIIGRGSNRWSATLRTARGCTCESLWIIPRATPSSRLPRDCAATPRASRSRA